LIQANIKMDTIKFDVSVAHEKSKEKLGSEIAASIRDKIEESKNNSDQNDEKMMRVMREDDEWSSQLTVWHVEQP